MKSAVTTAIIGNLSGYPRQFRNGPIYRLEQAALSGGNQAHDRVSDAYSDLGNGPASWTSFPRDDSSRR
jgi:hypothetical protein